MLLVLEKRGVGMAGGRERVSEQVSKCTARFVVKTATSGSGGIEILTLDALVCYNPTSCIISPS